MNTTVSAPADLAALKRTVKTLNAHCLRHCSGFYPSFGGRFFEARLREGKIEVFDFDKWFVCPEGATFGDSYGRSL